jgi:hypothetical protein
VDDVVPDVPTVPLVPLLVVVVVVLVDELPRSISSREAVRRAMAALSIVEDDEGCVVCDIVVPVVPVAALVLVLVGGVLLVVGLGVELVLLVVGVVELVPDVPVGLIEPVTPVCRFALAASSSPRPLCDIAAAWNLSRWPLNSWSLDLTLASS